MAAGVGLELRVSEGEEEPPPALARRPERGLCVSPCPPLPARPLPLWHLCSSPLDLWMQILHW